MFSYEYPAMDGESLTADLPVTRGVSEPTLRRPLPCGSRESTDPRLASRRWCRPMLWVALTALVMGLAFQGTRGLHETSEGRYALVAQEMLETGHWLEPTVDGRPHWTKPPLTYWVIASSMAVLGENAWGARAPAAIAHMLAAVFVVLAARAIFDARTGYWAGLIYAVAWLPMAGVNTVTTDIYLAMFTSGAIAGFAWSIAAVDARSARRAIAFMWLAFGGAFLTKGPPALLTLLPICFWRWSLPREKRPPFLTWPGALAFVVVGLGWYLWEIAVHRGLIERFVDHDFADNVLGDSGHNRAWWKSFGVFGPPMLLAAGLPGILALLRAFRHASRWRPTWRRWAQARDPRLFLLLWPALPLAIFVASHNKLPLYVLPFAAPAAILVAAMLLEAWSVRSLAAVVLVSGLLCLAGKAAFAFDPNRRDMRALATEVAQMREAHGAPRADVAIVTRDRLYGLQFYLNEKLERPERPGFQAELDAFVDQAVRSHLHRGFPEGLLFVVPKGSGPRVLAHVRRFGTRVDHEVGRFWELILLEPTASR